MTEPFKPITEESIYDACVARNIPITHHASDLYIPCTPETLELVKHFGHQAETFTNQVEGGLWLDVPFQYRPWWEAKQRLAKQIEEARTPE
jgi:hypothetical protein